MRQKWVRNGRSGAGPAVAGTTGMLLVVEPPQQAGRFVEVGPESILIGRDPVCDLVLTGANISRRHAAVRSVDGWYVVEDLGSTNGTVLNGHRTAGPRRLGDGDRIALAGVILEFRLGAVPPRWVPPRPGPPDRAGDCEETLPTGRLEVAAVTTAERRPSLRRELREAPGFSRGGLLFGVLGSVVGTVLTTAAGTGQWGALAGAALGPVLSTTFSTTRAGDSGRVRHVAVVLLSVAALIVTVTGFSLADLAAGRSVALGDHRRSTFPGGNAEPTQTGDTPGATRSDTPTGRPGIGTRPKAPGPLDCGTVEVGAAGSCAGPVIVISTGTGNLDITRIEERGPDPGSFTVSGGDCARGPLAPGDTCELTVTFRPGRAGELRAHLVIHQNLPSPDRGTTIELTGTGAVPDQPSPDQPGPSDQPGPVQPGAAALPTP